MNTWFQCESSIKKCIRNFFAKAHHLDLAILILTAASYCGTAVASTKTCSAPTKVTKNGETTEKTRYGLCEVLKGSKEKWITSPIYEYIFNFDNQFIAKKELSIPDTYATSIYDKNGRIVKDNIDGMPLAPIGNKRFIVIKNRKDKSQDDWIHERDAIRVETGSHSYNRAKLVGVNVLRTIPITTRVATQYDKRGEILSTDIHDSYSSRLFSYDENHMVAVGGDSKVGLVDVYGKWVVEPKYSFIGSKFNVFNKSEKPYWLFMNTDCGWFICSRQAELRDPMDFKVFDQWSDYVYANYTIRNSMADIEDWIAKAEDPKNLEILLVTLISLAIFGATLSYYHYYKKENLSYSLIHAVVFMGTAALTIAVSMLFLVLIFAAPLALASYRRD